MPEALEGTDSKASILDLHEMKNRLLFADNTFRNNPVSYVALLWGVKNNYHHDNAAIQSGQIKVEEQQKLEILN